MKKSFQQKVLQKIKSIPKGRVTTYKALAHSLKTRAYRAVGQACKNNPDPFTYKSGQQKTPKTKTPYTKKTPCHRVIPSDGTIGNYNQGQKAKIALLKKEGIKIKNGKVDPKQIIAPIM